MTIAVLEPNKPMIMRLVPRLERLLCGDGDVLAYTSADLFLTALKTNHADLIFMQADAPDTKWTDLQKWLAFRQPWAKIVLMADSDVYALEAIRAHVHDYLVTPISDEQLMHAFTEVDAYEPTVSPS